MPYDTTTVIIGAGQAGLAFSRHLADRGVDHVVLERGRVANSWRTERWDSLRLLTPNWQTRLPGFAYTGPDPDGYMTMPEISDHLAAFAGSFHAPVHEQTPVRSVRPSTTRPGSFEVDTDQASWRTRKVVVATGAFSTPAIPAVADDVPQGIHQLAPNRYRNPSGLPDGGVLVVGASASGIQLADELARAGRQVTIAAGRHTRLPRVYRGLDMQWWLDATGTLDVRHDGVRDIGAARRAPSLQLMGTPERRSVDLGTLAGLGVRVAGRLEGIDHSGRASFADDLAENVASSEVTLRRLLDRCDRFATEMGLDAELDAPTRPACRALGSPVRSLDLRRDGITTVIWATGFRPNYPWLHAPVFAPNGAIRHDGGVVRGVDGLYVMGLPFMRRRRSSFIDGAGDDARDLSSHLVSTLDAREGRLPVHAVRH